MVKPKIKGPKTPGEHPVAVVGNDGCVYPMPCSPMDRLYFLGIADKVTFLYDKKDAEKIAEYNEGVMRSKYSADQLAFGVRVAPEEAKGILTEEGRPLKFEAGMLDNPHSSMGFLQDAVNAE